MRRRSGVLAAGALCLLGCTSFPNIESNVCGNGVLERERGEACDGHVEKKGEICRPPGAVGECQYDCRIGSDGHLPVCPEGQGCAVDGICRPDTGGYEEPRGLSTEATSWLTTADFDGDHRVDLVSAEPPDQLLEARFRVHYFDPEGRNVETRTFPRVTTRPVVRDVNDDGVDDFVFSNFRVGMLPGRADREWVPATFSSYQVPNSGLRVAGVSDDYVGGAAGLVVLTAFDGQSGIFAPNYLTTRLELRAKLPAPVQELAGSPLATDIVEGVDSPCRELVLAFRGAPSFSVFDLCELTSDPALPEVVWRQTPIERSVTLPPGLTIDAGPISADVDGDGHLDVIVGVANQPYVALGDGHGLQPLAAPLDIEVPTRNGSTLVEFTMPLAAGDVSGDAVADYVLPGYIVVSRPRLSGVGMGYLASFENRGAPWTMAEVADLNGNGLADVIAATQGAPGLSFMNGTGGAYLVGASLPSDGPLRFLATGDFDGDLISDVAYVESGPPTEGSDFLSVAFGTRDTPPLRGKRVAALKNVEQLGTHGELGLETLFVAANEMLDGRPFSTLTMFDGDADRLPFAPYTLVTFLVDGSIQDSAATALVVGSFRSPDSHDLLAVGMESPRSDWTQWLAQDIASGQHPPRLLDGGHPEGILPVKVEGDDVRLAVSGATADLDRDGLDEALWLMPEGADSCALLIFGIDVRRGATQQKGVVHFAEPCEDPELASADLDRDGAPDILLLIGEAPRRLQLLWNDGIGRFALENSDAVLTPAAQDVRAFSVFPDLQRIAVVTDGGLHVVSPSAERQFDRVSDVHELNDARAVVVFDPNGDQISEIAVADAEGIRLFEARLE
jgi:hypothetical protein